MKQLPQFSNSSSSSSSSSRTSTSSSSSRSSAVVISVAVAVPHPQYAPSQLTLSLNPFSCSPHRPQEALGKVEKDFSQRMVNIAAQRDKAEETFKKEYEALTARKEDLDRQLGEREGRGG